MDEIIYLEPDEEITSAIDKIKKAQSTNLGLVIPRDATLLQSVINLRLLSREAKTLGKNISIVTSDKIGRNLASQIGLSVFSSIEDKAPINQIPTPKVSEDEVLEVEPVEDVPTQNSGFKVQHYQTGAQASQGGIDRSMARGQASEAEPVAPSSHASSSSSHTSPLSNAAKPVVWNRHEKPTLKGQYGHFTSNAAKGSVGGILAKKDKDFKNLHKILWPVIGVFIVLCLVATYLLLPKATVSVFVPSETLDKELTLSVSDQVKVASVENSVLPGTLIESSGSKDGKFTTTGKKDIGQKTKGTITISNNLDSNSHSFPVGTQLSSSSKTFLTTSAVTVPGAEPINFQLNQYKPGTATVTIEAQNPGAEYNVKAGRFTILGISAVQQNAIYGQSSADLTGGLSKVAQVVSQQDYDSAKDGLIKEITDTLNKELQTKADGKEMLEKAIAASTPEITSTAKVNDEAADFQMTVKIKDQAVIFVNDEMSALVNEILQKQVTPDKMVTIANSEDLVLGVKDTAYDKGQLNLTAKIKAQVSPKISSNDIQQSILGKKQAEAEKTVQGVKGVDRVEISFKPSWWPKIMPNFKRGVIIKVEYINQEQK